MHRKPRIVPAMVLGALLVCFSVIPLAHAEESAEVGTVFDSGGNPLMTWWRGEESRGRTFFALFLSTRWLEPIAAIDATVVRVEEPATPVVRRNPGTFSTKDVGPTPTKDTINEDINPFENAVVGDPEDSDPSTVDE